jgi:TPR repeat protein
MMAELLFLGFGVPKDVDTARKLYCSAVEAGYPAALVGLSRIEKEAKRYRRAILYYFRALFQAAKLVVKNKDHPLLAGIGGKYHTFRRDWIG